MCKDSLIRLVECCNAEALKDELAGYWQVYGGFKSLIVSPWLWLAVAVTFFCWPFSSQGGWIGAAFSILPSLLGLSIGAMAITLAFPTTSIFNLLAENGRENSYYLDVASKFLHFVLVQVTALLFCFFASAYPAKLTNIVAFLMTSYAILTAAATATTLYGVAQVYNKSASSLDEVSAPSKE